MNVGYLAALLLAGAGFLSPAYSAEQAHAHVQVSTSSPQSALPTSADAAAPTLTLLPVRADVLKDGYVYLPFHVENLTILPLYTEIHGKETTSLRPKIGHLHVMVDNNGWNWIHAIADPIYFGPLPRGAHQVKVELVDAAHQVIEVKTASIVVP